jgi:catechol 2,3-dioxygenase-like lactoylglutathione lyase family enzyme
LDPLRRRLLGIVLIFGLYRAPRSLRVPVSVKGFHHVGVVVEDIGRVAEFLRVVLGLRSEPGVSRSDLITLFFSIGDTRIELIELLDPSARSRRLGGSSARIEHVALEVGDVQQTLRALQVFGVRPMASPQESAGSLTFWTDPETTQGVSFQFLQRLVK